VRNIVGDVAEEEERTAEGYNSTIERVVGDNLAFWGIRLSRGGVLERRVLKFFYPHLV